MMMMAKIEIVILFDQYNIHVHVYLFLLKANVVAYVAVVDAVVSFQTMHEYQDGDGDDDDMNAEGVDDDDDVIVYDAIVKNDDVKYDDW
mmetsp:Transcript_15516/g.22981  ORF Transcript_15516/g.22981 Transcript_15516/m.22981 type:complete len:89 (-) Transcript_15516:35-301(-)